MMQESQPHAIGDGESPAAGQHSEGGVLVVRSEDLRERVGAALAGAGVSREVGMSPSYLSAMGQVVSSKPTVVIGPVAGMTGMVASTARALRKLCPDARLVAVAKPEERDEAQAALAAGFDHCLFEPADATALLSALRVGPAHAGAETASPTQALDVPAPTPPADVQVVQNELGDIDLVRAVTQDSGGLVELAVHLIGQQSRLPGVAFAASASEVSPEHAVVAVHSGGRSLGLLHAPAPTTAEQLAPWADWLADWLALDCHVSGLRQEAMTDELTGVWNRRYFQRFLESRLEEAARERQQVTLLLFDIDDFKQYNDKYGHPAGDEILRETARLILSLVRDHDIVARIGGDEFAVVFWDKGEPRHLGSQHPDNVLGIARRFQKAICEHKYPKLGHEAVGRLTVSGGLAGFPWDGRTPEELIAQADAMAIQSKRTGKNVICFGPGAAPNGNGGSNP